ncbi:MAG: hypothetical protein RR766_00790 [Longicatena sp.]
MNTDDIIQSKKVLEEKIQKITDEFGKKIDSIVSAKTKEIMSV